jgi:hypothetical protein
MAQSGTVKLSLTAYLQHIQRIQAEIARIERPYRLAALRAEFRGRND